MIKSYLRHLLPLGIRAQLMLWYTAVFALLILLFSIVLYTTLDASLASGVDTALQIRTQQIAAGVTVEGDKISIQDVTGDLPGLDNNSTSSQNNNNSTSNTNQSDEPNSTGNAGSQAGFQTDVNIGTLVRILNSKGKVLYSSPAFSSLSVPAISITNPLHGTPWRGTITAHNGQTVRLYSIALIDNDHIFGVIQVGEPLAQLTLTLQSITIALLIIAPFVLLLGAIVSYWLAKRAFKPIFQLTRTARDIKAGDLHRRVPVPQAKDEVHDLALTLNEMIGRLDLAFTQQRRFVADASHELRTPVAVIRNITDVALVQPLALDEYITLLRDINVESERLGQLINDLLALARADEGQIPLDQEEIRLDLLACDVAATMEALAIERGITLNLEKMEPATVKGDTARIIQVIMGLVDNALTYTNAGGTATINVETHETSASFSVRDTGIGISAEDIPHIFERFYRTDPARSRVVGGSGLGLAIVDWVVRAHGGSVSVESQVGQGSTFTVTLPLASSISSSPPYALSSSSTAKTGNLIPGQSQAAETQPSHH
jgi:heavy metal sensor kinase